MAVGTRVRKCSVLEPSGIVSTVILVTVVALLLWLAGLELAANLKQGPQSNWRTWEALGSPSRGLKESLVFGPPLMGCFGDSKKNSQCLYVFRKVNGHLSAVDPHAGPQVLCNSYAAVGFPITGNPVFRRLLSARKSWIWLFLCIHTQQVLRKCSRRKFSCLNWPLSPYAHSKHMIPAFRWGFLWILRSPAEQEARILSLYP